MGNSWKYISFGFIILIAQILVSDFVNIWPMLYVAIFPIYIISLPLSLNRTDMRTLTPMLVGTHSRTVVAFRESFGMGASTMDLGI